jgi:uroporphyrin-III C-methyltransferase
VGAGPGDPELLTVRAARLLARADVVFHDELVSAGVKALINPRARVVAAGHRAGALKRPVEKLVALMTERAQMGELVVRLKGGDPYLFGRGAEEAAMLLAAGADFQVVPGVSAALAAPAAAGIPVTHRDLASSVTIVTGHEREGAGRVCWDRLATGADTLVVLMGARRLHELSQSIMDAGRSALTPAAVVMAATLPQQRQVVGTLGSIADAARDAGLGPPAILVVGDVARLAEVLGKSYAAVATRAGAETDSCLVRM